MKLALTMQEKIIILPTLIGVALIALGLFFGDVGVTGNLIILAIFVAVVPYFIYRYTKLLWIRAVENQFPNFVRDLADAMRSGISMPDAISSLAKGNYGKLTEEVRLMKNRLSWGTPLFRVLEIFGRNTKHSTLIQEALSIIFQSYESGGNIVSTLEAVADDMLILKEAESERASLVNQHVMIMYGVFFMFLGVSITIIFIMIPIIENQPLPTAGQGTLGFQFSSPCEGIGIFPCPLFDGIAAVLDVEAGIGAYYIPLFFLVTIIQGLFTGLIAGQLGENSMVAGTKHSLIMVLSALGVFLFLAKAGLLPA